MPLDITEYIWTKYKQDIPKTIQGMLRSVYDKQATNIGREALLFFYSMSRTRKNVMDPMNAEMIIGKQLAQLAECKYPEQAIEKAWQVIRVFNQMNVRGRDWAKDHTETELPFIIWEKCPWIISVALFIEKFRPEEYPQVPGWVDFFMWLPQTKVAEGKAYMDFRDYAYACSYGSFDSWYAARYGCGDKDPSKSYRQIYQAELRYQSKDSLTKEANRGHWGCADVKAELRRREKEDGKK
jgi:hypothetical protein